MGKDSQTYLASAELAPMLAKTPSVSEYREKVAMLDTMADDVCRYLNFDEIGEYREVADTVHPGRGGLNLRACSGTNTKTRSPGS